MDEGHNMIDPVEFGELKGRVASLQQQFGSLQQQQATISAKLDQLINQLAEARGGWKMMMVFGGAAASLGSGITFLLQHWKVA